MTILGASPVVRMSAALVERGRPKRRGIKLPTVRDRVEVRRDRLGLRPSDGCSPFCVSVVSSGNEAKESELERSCRNYFD